MSLVGNLADLGLGDIFQIVSLSRRSGTLQLTTPDESGDIVFLSGKVVAAGREKPSQHVGDVLLNTGVVTPTVYQEMLAAQTSGVLGEALFAQFQLPAEGLDKAFESMLTRMVYEMFEWDEGTFSFVLEQEPSLWRGFSLLGGRVVLSRGLNPQYLAIEGARIRDEKHREDPLETFLASQKHQREPKGEAGLGLSSALRSETPGPDIEFDVLSGAEGAREPARPVPLDDDPTPVPGEAPQAARAPEPEPEPEPEQASAPEASASDDPQNIIPFPQGGRPRRDTAPSDPPAPLLPPPAPIIPAPSSSPATARATPVIPPPAPIVPAPMKEARAPRMEAPARVEVPAAPERPEALFGELELDGKVTVRAKSQVLDVPVRREEVFEDPGPTAEDREPRAEDRGPRAEDRGPRAEDRGPRAEDREPTTEDREPTTEDREPKAEVRSVVAAPVAVAAFHLLVVDDDAVVTRFIAAALGGDFASVQTATRVPEAIAAFERLGSAPVVVATDLILPRSDGRGILGGVEILEAIRKRSKDAPVVMFSDYQNEEAEARARAMGVHAFVMKPRKSQVQLDPEGATPSDLMVAFMKKLREALDAYAGKAQAAEPADGSYDLSSDLAEHLGEIVERAEEELGPRGEGRIEYGNLRSMLAELIDPANRDTITLLVLRFASDVVERAALFLATRRAYVGLGGFSHEEASDTFVQRVRRIQVPVEMDSIFAKIMRYRTMIRGPLADNEGNRRLIDGLGGRFHTNAVVAAPIISGDRVAAILFGDNPSGKPLGSTEGLEIFLQQAGLAMDRALLERRLEESRRKRSDDE